MEVQDQETRESSDKQQQLQPEMMIPVAAHSAMMMIVLWMPCGLPISAMLRSCSREKRNVRSVGTVATVCMRNHQTASKQLSASSKHSKSPVLRVQTIF
jgi:hypothetical protein